MAKPIDYETIYDRFVSYSAHELSDASDIPLKDIRQLLKAPQVKVATIKLMQHHIESNAQEYCIANNLPAHYAMTGSLEDRLNVLQSAIGYEAQKDGLQFSHTLHKDIDNAVQSIIEEPLHDLCTQLADEHSTTPKVAVVERVGDLGKPRYIE